MKKLLIAASLLTGGGIAAEAADLPTAPYSRMIPALYDWSGFYTGLNGGGGRGRDCWDRNTGLGGTFLSNEGCHDASGWTFGGQVGYRAQVSSLVFGIEAQFNGSRLSGSNSSLIAPLNTTTNSSRIDGFGLFTGQVGFSLNDLLLYAKGGAAVTSARYNGSVGGVIFDTVNEYRWGAVAGGGLEFSFAPNWSLAVEYDHLFMGSRAQDFLTLASPAVFSREDRIRQSVDVVTLRVNYRWDHPVIAKY